MELNIYTADIIKIGVLGVPASIDRFEAQTFILQAVWTLSK